MILLINLLLSLKTYWHKKPELETPEGLNINSKKAWDMLPSPGFRGYSALSRGALGLRTHDFKVQAASSR